MLIFWKERLVFLANTRCGSTSIESALESLAHVAVQRPPPLKHTSASAFRRYLAPYLELAAGEAFTTVALMREPTDWLGSWYRHRQRADLPLGEPSTDGMAYPDFVTSFLSDSPPPVARLESQAEFLSGPDGGPLVDRIFRYEDLGGFLAFLEERLDCEITLPRDNVAPSASTELTQELSARLRERFAPDYVIYDALTPR
ncbi:hypothetical protein [Ostreiculturibacter nitratireducens]|uniref:hypothetical protein n=1 Tax=Ostreiculturibacter nitratireducens TaxID=3075226 RepID=UPI0031B5F1AC